MNQYGLPLASNSVQTVLPAMDESGRVYGFYPIASTTFTGSETTFTLPDTEVPVKSVTVDPGHSVTQYMAAVWPIGLAHNYKPWEGSASFVTNSEGYYRWYSMPTQGWVTHFGAGTLIKALNQGMTSSYSAPSSAAPVAASAAMEWTASIDYSALYGDQRFFDFNWMTVFAAKSSLSPVRIVVLSNPAPIAPSTVSPLKATVVGTPVPTNNGPVYDTVRILKLGEEGLDQGEYVFTFRVYDDRGQSTPVTLTLTVA